jgi:3-dehydroquinate synthase
MQHKFVVNGTEYFADDTITKRFVVNSHPSPYEVVFKPLPTTFSDKEVLLVDANVQKLYNIQHDRMIVVEAIEENKSIETVLDVCQTLLNFEFDKGNTLVAIGGGIIQDIAAFAAKIYKRGVRWVFYPTTLLSQCDSCIGGKTALNFKNNKNQLALFSAPDMVVIDTKFLKTLTNQDIVSGYGEIVKLFLIGGEFYINNIDSFDMETTIFHSLMIKKAVIEGDEFEVGDRKSLNYGHSFGHVIEPMKNYEIPHGEAVLLGMEIINKLFDNNPSITKLINKFTSLDKVKSLDAERVIKLVKTDKKVVNGIITLIRVNPIGVTTFEPTNIDQPLEVRISEILTN